MKRPRLPVLLGALLLGLGGVDQPPSLIVHEWGTITTRHAPDGTPRGHLNRISESEVLPPFVHQFEPAPVQADPQKSLLKTPLTPGRPDVTMRLETPVIYFYPPTGSDSFPPFDVSVRFRGGVLNEFYPRAEASVAVDAERIASKMRAGVVKSWDGEVLNNYVVGSLLWKGLSLKHPAPLPQTSSHVWLAPREVRSAPVLAASGEGERYLFYRGVAHLDALVQTEVSATEVRLRAPQRLLWLHEPMMTIDELWLVDIRSDGTVAFRERKKIDIAKSAASQELARVPLFTEKDYAADGLKDLRASMKQALISKGLLEDEAEAMLETWKESYYHAPGLRIFYLVPDQWLAYFLPLEISIPHDLKRVLVGRVDLLRD